MNFLRLRSHIAVFAILNCLICSCNSPEYLPEKDLHSYVLDEDNELAKSVAAGNTKIKVIYRPTDLLVAQELRSSASPSREEIAGKREKYRHHYYFILSLSQSGKDILTPNGQAGFSELLQTISFRMNEVVNLTTSQRDTISVADFVYNRTFGLSNSTDILLVFDKSEIGKTEKIWINLDEFGLGLGRQSIEFDVRKLEEAPGIYKL